MRRLRPLLGRGGARVVRHRPRSPHASFPPTSRARSWTPSARSRARSGRAGSWRRSPARSARRPRDAGAGRTACSGPPRRPGSRAGSARSSRASTSSGSRARTGIRCSGPGSPTSRCPASARRRPAASAPDGDPLFERLRAWRLERAREESVPAFVVFSDKTLREMAAVKPADARGARGGERRRAGEDRAVRHRGAGRRRSVRRLIRG